MISHLFTLFIWFYLSKLKYFVWDIFYKSLGYKYYDYGFTRFNFEHALPKELSDLLIGANSINNEVFERVNELKNNLPIDGDKFFSRK